MILPDIVVYSDKKQGTPGLLRKLFCNPGKTVESYYFLRFCRGVACHKQLAVSRKESLTQCKSPSAPVYGGNKRML